MNAASNGTAPCSPTTCIARWNTPNPHQSLPLLARSLSTRYSSTSTGRYQCHIRTLRLHKEQRSVYILRTIDRDEERTALLIQDPSAPIKDNKGKGKQRQDQSDDTGMAAATAKTEDPPHYRWTYTNIASPHFSTSSSSSSSSSSATSASIDSFIGRVLVAPTSTSNSVNSSSSQPSTFWQPRPTALSLEGASFQISSNPIQYPNHVDWIVKVAIVTVKGGTASGTTRGCIVEATYLPVPYLPASSHFIQNFLLSIFPSSAIEQGQVTILNPSSLGSAEGEGVEYSLRDVFETAEAGREEEDDGEGWEWTERHSLFSYVQQFKKEGLL